MSIDCTFYSDDKTTFHIDIDDEWESEKRFKRCPTLTITHGGDGKALHFVTLEQLQVLRDLLIEKLPIVRKATYPASALEDVNSQNLGWPKVVAEDRAEIVKAMHTMPGVPS